MEAKRTCYLVLLIQFTSYVNCYDVYKRYYEKCYMPTKGGTCCDVAASFQSTINVPIISSIDGICLYDIASQTDICTADGNSGSQCLVNSQPYLGFAHPLGLMSGIVKSSQITFSNTLDASRNVRLFSTGLGWSAPDEGLLKINFGRKIKITYIIFQNGGASARLEFANFRILIGNDDVKYQDMRCYGVFGANNRRTCRHLLPRPLRTSVLTIKAKQPAETVKLEVGGMDYLEPDNLLRFDTILYHPGSLIPHFPDERGNYSVQTEIMEQRSLSKSVLLVNDFTQQTTIASSHVANNTARSIITACLADSSDCNGFTIAFWGKGPFSNFYVSESTNSNGFLLAINDNELSMNLEGVTKSLFSVSVCECWKHFIIGVKCSTSPPVITFYEDGSKKTSTSNFSSQAVEDTPFTVSPVINFRNLGIWNFTVNDEEAAKIFTKGDSFMDFKIPAFEDFGDWKLATTLCDSTNQGPCSDYALSQTTGDAEVPLQYNAKVAKTAFYDAYTHFCHPTGSTYALRPKIPSLLAFEIDLTHIGVDIKALSSAVLNTSFTSTAFKGFIEIYAVRSYDYNDKYMQQCRFKFMYGDVKADPIHWEKSTSSSIDRIVTPDLSQILSPFLEGKENTWTKKAVIVLKFMMDLQITLSSFKSEVNLTYFDRTPERFLYADLISAPAQGHPLTYTTRYFPPVKKCLKFYYHMNGDDVGYFAIHFLQGVQLREIFRLVGNQGTGWKSATVPLGEMDLIGPQFRIAFLASRGEKVSGSVAIDNIELLDTAACEYEPMSGKPSYHSSGIPHIQDIGCSENGSFTYPFIVQLVVIPPMIINPELKDKSCSSGISFISATVSHSHFNLSLMPSALLTDTISSGFELLKMEKALVLVPLIGDANRDLFNSATTGGDSLNFTLVRDIHGYPLRRNHLASNGLKIVLASAVNISSHFSFSIQLKPEKLTSSVVLQIKITSLKHIVFSMEPDGNLSTSFISDSSSQAMHTVSTSNVFANNSWVNLVVTYSNSSGMLTVYTNATKAGSHSVQQYMQGLALSCESFELAPDGDSFGRPSRFNGYMTCFQFYKYELQPHQITAIRICPDRISNHTCHTKCHDDGACDAITGKCICPHYASRYIDTRNCASRLYESLYKRSSVSLMTFDSFNNLKKTFGNGKLFEDSVYLYNALEAGRSDNAIFASVPGPINLAICTISNQKIPLPGISSCLLTKTCTTGFAVTLWIKPTLVHFLTQKDTVILEVGALRVLYGSPYCNYTTSPSFKFQVENGSQLCTWALRENCVSSQAWTQILFSFDAVSRKAFVLENGVIGVLRRVHCATATPLPADSKIGGSAMHVCIDNLVLWDRPLKTSFAMKICCSFSYCGMAVRPRKLNFQMTAYDEILESLWALDDYGRVYHYSKRAWVLVGKEMVHISAGINGVFGIGRDSKVYQREGITSKNKTGTAWKIFLQDLLWKKVCSGYKFGSIYLIDSNHKLYCLLINSMTKHDISAYTGAAQDVSCAAGECWITRTIQKCRKIKLTSGCTCNYETELSEKCTQAIVSRESYLAVLQDQELKRYKYRNGFIADFVAANIKHASFVHSEFWAITTSGNLKIIKNEGQDSFSIRHFHGKPFRGDRLAYNWEYSTFHFARVGNMCLRMLHDQLYIKVRTDYVYLQDNCDRSVQSTTVFSYSSDSTIHWSWGNKVLYLNTAGHIRLITNASYTSSSSYSVENGQFYFITDSFKGPTSFISQRKQADEFGGAVKVPITVEFKLNDYKFIKNFRDSQGLEAKMIYSKVNEELYQAFRDCPFYMGVSFKEIKFLRNIELWCHNNAASPTVKKDTCNRPLIVQFTGSLSFGHISELERNVLSSDKFSGKETDCQGNSCWLRANGGSYGYSVAHQPNIKLVRFSINDTSDVRAVFQYHEDVFCTGHTGYFISSNAHSMIDPNQKTNRSGRTNDSTTFFLKYPPYFAVNLSVTPLHVQYTALKTVSFSFVTPETKPDAPPESITCGPNGQHWLELQIASIPWSGWNGVRHGYHVFYKKTNWNQALNSHTGPFSPGNLTSYSFSNSSALSDSFEMNLGKLELFTKYEIFVGGYNSLGLGPLRRVVCMTREGVPEVAPTNIVIQQQSNNSVLIKWDPVPDDPELWNSENKSTRTYKVFYYEYTAANSSAAYFESSKSMHELTNLEAGRGYKFAIAAKSGIGEGVASEYYCIRMSETVPTAPPCYVRYWAKNASAIYIGLSPIDNVYDENGVISHYRISLEEFNTYDEAPVSPTNQFFYSAYVERSSPISFLKTRVNFTNVAVKCNSSFREVLGKTSQLMQVTISNLRYYTRYGARASACTVAGCGPWSKASGLTRTAEFHPTCPPANVSIQIKSSTSLEIHWNHLEKSCTHGIVTQYQLLAGEVDSFKVTHPAGIAAWPIFNESTYHERFHALLPKDAISYFDNSAFLKKEFHGLKKFFTYCVQINGFTVVGGGPKSNLTCGRTLQDYPDGPPTNLTGFSNSSTSLVVKLCLPAADKANGIITHYTVFYSVYNTSETQNITVPATCDNETCELCAQAVINGLKKFTVYELKAAASTKVGMGPKSENFTVVRTLEDAPSSCVQNASSFLITDKDSFVAWRNTPIELLHGVFHGFNIDITEQLQDGIILQRRAFIINKTLTQEADMYGRSIQFNMAANVSNAYIWNKTDNLNKSAEYFYLNLIGLKAYAFYNVTLASCTRPGCGPQCRSVFLTKERVPTGTVQEFKASSLNSTSIQLRWQPLAVIDRNGIIANYEISWINTCLSGSSTAENSTEQCLLSLSHKTKHYGNVTISADKSSVVLTDFVPFTRYEFGVVAATSVGQGPRFMLMSDTPQDVPSAAPNFTEIYNTSSSSIMLKWMEIPYANRNGIIIRHRLRFVESHGAENNPTHLEVLVPVSSDGFYKYEITNLKRHTLYDILINGVTAKGDGSVRNVSAKTGPYVNGHWSDWTDWTFCTAFCGGGIQFRERSCTNPRPWNGGDDCVGSKRENQTCNNDFCSGKVLTSPNEDCNLTCSSRGQICIVNLEITPYTDESQFIHSSTPCKIILNSWSSSIHTGLSENTGTCKGKPTWLECMEGNVQTTRRICNCYRAVDLGYGLWSAWSFCSHTCGGGTKTRTRSCLLGEGKCDGPSYAKLDCNINSCPVNGAWGSWSEFHPCNKSCGYGYRNRYRKCDSPSPLGGGRDCYGPSTDSEGGCNPQICPVNGGWSKFGPYMMCSQPCGNGVAIRRRYCNSPKPSYGGKYCEGSNEDSKPCNPNPCSELEVKCNMKIEMEWNFRYVYLQSQLTKGLVENIRKNLLSLYSNASVIAGIRIHNFYKGSVVANFSIFFESVKNVEVVILQDAISSQKKVGNLTVSKLLNLPDSSLPSPPENLSAAGLSPFSISLSWQFNEASSLDSNISSFFVLMRKVNSEAGNWDVIGVPKHVRAFNITDLQAVTTYRIRMSVAVTFSNGVGSDEILGTTLEGAPDTMVQGLQLQAIQPTEVYLEWQTMKETDFNGYPKGYVIRYRSYSESTYNEKLVEYGSISDTIKGLTPFTIHIFELMAYTAAGRGPPVAKVIKTLEGQPGVAPPNVRVQQLIATNHVIVRWDDIPDDKHNGIFQGFKLRYSLVSSGGRRLVPQGHIVLITTDKFTFEYVIAGLQSYSTYEITISGFTNTGEGPRSAPVTADTCKCPSPIFLNWFENRPYVTKTGRPPSVEGIFAQIITNTIESSCGLCNGRKSIISTFQSLSGENPEKESELAVRAAIGKEYHVSFPVRGKSEITRYMGVHAFVTIVESNGVATIVRDEVDRAGKTRAAFESMIKVWPMYIIIILTTLMAGICIWFFEHLKNEDFEKGNYLKGILQGFWWAFISATTVGYGDITPKTIPGRIFGVIWTLVSLVLNGILIGSLTSSVTTLTLPPAVKLYGTTAAAITNSTEFELAIRRNSIIASAEYATSDSVLDALASKFVDIGLLDAFVAAANAEKIKQKQLKVKEVIKTTSAFGVVLSHELLRLEDDFKSQIASKQNLIGEFVSNVTSLLKVSEEAKTVVLLLDPSSSVFWDFLEALAGLASILAVAGFIVSHYFKWRHHKRNRSIKPDHSSAIAASIDDDIQDFFYTVNKIGVDMDKAHKKKLQELAWLKKNYARYLERRALYRPSNSQFNDVHMHSNPEI